jgi:16S rRNA A1518/A1519 N6-dimethyltransferase RsmA/KsgA/DIM1 with predicted DNA glycosylase/AP lyase activity
MSYQTEVLEILLVLGAVIFVVFNFVILFGAPFLPTMKKEVKSAVKLMDLKPGQRMLELGSGDGRLLIAAAEAGLYATGIELNPLLVIYSWFKTRKYKGRVKVIWGNFWKKEWPPTDGIFVFLLDPYMKRLNTRITQKYKNPVKLVSFAFKVPNRDISGKKRGLFLYEYNQK